MAKETANGARPKVNKIQKKDAKEEKGENKKVCFRCGNPSHVAPNCPHKEKKCNYCQKVGHLESMCFKKRRNEKKGLKVIRDKQPHDKMHAITSKLEVPIQINESTHQMELDTGTTGNFISENIWRELGTPQLGKPSCQFKSATNHDLPLKGVFTALTSNPETGSQADIEFTVTEMPELNILGQKAIHDLNISLDKVLKSALSIKVIKDSEHDYKVLEEKCKVLCEEFPDLFKDELGCLKDVELEVKFKDDAKPIFHKPRPVPFSVKEDLTKAYDAGIEKGVWTHVQFNDYGTPVVPHRKALQPGQIKPKLRVCGDYSTGINDQLEMHRQPIPRPEELMESLGGGYGYSKIDLADAYHQIKLAPTSQKRLALSTHRGVLLQQRLPFGIKSAPGYFQEIMEKLTRDLPGVAVYLDDLLVSGRTADEHLSNLRGLLQRLSENGLRCRKGKCVFAQARVEYLGHTLSADGVSKGSKIDDVCNMAPPTDVSTVKAFLGAVQFYSKFIPNMATLAEPLHELTRKGESWRWTEREQNSFQNLKEVLSSDQVLVHFDAAKPLGLSCDASSVGLGAVLWHRFPDGSERPIVYASKTLNKSQRNYSQVHKEALAIVFGLHKFYQYLYGQAFTLITDHKPLLALFSPTKGTPILAANRLARWALWLNQFNYTIQYRRTQDHGNADALSRLPAGEDLAFDEEESGEDCDMVCAIHAISQQVSPLDSALLVKESEKDSVIAAVKRFVREGWPQGDLEENVKKFKKMSGSLAICNGCLVMGSRVVIPENLQQQVLELLHTGHFGMERMKQLARTAVYWPGIDDAIERTCRMCQSCAEHQNKPAKPTIHPWMLPEKPWSRIHIDHAVNFMGTNWLVITDAYSRYPCIHPTTSVSTKATIDLLEDDFTHFGYPHTLVSDNGTSFTSEEFQSWCKERGIVHLTGAPYHPATNGAAERLVQSFKQALRKSALPPKQALQEFLIQYRRTPTACGYSPSELLNGRQIRTRVDTLMPSPAHLAQGKQDRAAAKVKVVQAPAVFQVGDPVYAEYFGPRGSKTPRWIPGVILKKGARTFQVRVSEGKVWKRHLEQLHPRYVYDEDKEPPEEVADETEEKVVLPPSDHPLEVVSVPSRYKIPPPEYGPDNPRRSKRKRKPKQLMCCSVPRT